MNNSEEKTELLIKYLDGALSEDERLVLEAELKSNSALRAELENMKIAQLALKHYGLRADVAAVHKDMMLKLKQPKPELRKNQLFSSLLRVAAIFIIALFLGFCYKFLSVNEEKVFNEQYISYSSDNDRGNQAESPIEYAYKAQHFSQVTVLYKAAKSNTTKENFLAAQAYIELNQPADASLILRDILKTEGMTGNFHDDAEYYLGLCNIAEDNFTGALDIFNKIYQDQTHAYHGKVSIWTLLDLKILALKK